MMELVRTGVIGELMASGATIRTAFCGPCFGAGDVPANGALSIRHTTRNFPSREGSKPGSGQLSGVALMDARSIAATTANGGILTPATDVDYDPTVPEYQYDASSYDTRVYQGFGKGDYDALLKFGPNIKDWPEIAPLGDNLLLKVASYITDPVTTTDELIPSGETLLTVLIPWVWPSSPSAARTRSMWPRQAVQAEENARRAGAGDAALLAKVNAVPGCEQLNWNDIQIASTIFAVKPGDGSAVSRPPAASVCWVPVPISLPSTLPSVTALTSSTGVCCPCSWQVPPPLVWGTMCSSPMCGKYSRATCRTSRPTFWAIPSRSLSCTWLRSPPTSARSWLMAA